MIRTATIDDLDVLVQHRHSMFAAMNYGSTEELQNMSDAFRAWVESEMRAGRYFAWLKMEGDVAIGGAGVWLLGWPPTVADPHVERAMILNVYTHPDHRRKGIARELMETAIAWCRQRGLHTVILHASKAGRPLYEQLGFTATNEMRLQGF